MSMWRLVLVLLLAWTVHADAAMVKCTKTDGTMYIGPTPPAGCEVRAG